MRKSGLVALLFACFGMAAGAGTTPLKSSSTERMTEAAFVEAIEAIRHADYRGDREELRRRGEQLAGETPPSLTKYRLYWSGFAYWRRAINGFNLTAVPGDIFADQETAVADFRAALALDPDFEDAKSAVMGCMMSEMFLVPAEQAELHNKVRQDLIAAIRAVNESAQENPRTLWILGQKEIGAPPPYGGDMAKAAALFERGLAAARREARGEPREPWLPSWGAAESLMNLAYLYSRGTTVNREVARAYALGALAIAPDWHFVGDILLPAIEALPASKESMSAAPSCSFSGTTPSPTGADPKSRDHRPDSTVREELD